MGDSDATTGDDLAREAPPAAEGAPRLEERIEGERSYRLLGLLGEGGMGRVYLAERADGEYRQRVAIKKLAWFVARDADAAKRFRAERQILARLTHPNIARLLDGGTTPEGQPYLVMEYVEGEPIDDYAERHALPLASRLALFLKVCDAVRLAHQNLIVHRDLKPGNILVEATGEPKLLDFGIAKLLDPEAVGDAAQTRRGETLLTPRYASPEQVLGGVITTASDIYSLGVVLYELVAGQAPYNVTLTAPAELVRAICETQPLPPSSARPRTAGRSEPRIPRDLDEIVLKALRKEPGERYVSVEALAEDIARFLDGRPVEARRGGRSYRLSRFVKRHRWSLAAAALFLATVAAFIFGLQRQLDETQRQRDEASRQRDAAQAVTDFLVKLFAASDPTEARGEEITARAVLDRGAARIDKELAAQPEIRATLLHHLALVHQNLGAFDRAGELFREALTAREKLHPPTHREVVETRYRLGWNHAQNGAFAEGEAILRQALRDLDAAPWRDPVTEVMILNGLGASLVYQSKHADAERFLLRALGLRGAPELAANPPFMGTLNNLGLLNLYQERWAVAIPYFREALELELAAHGENHPNEALLRSNLSWCLSGERRFEEAEREARRAAEVGRKVLGPLHMVTEYAEYRWGWALQHLGRLDEAEVVQRGALAARQKTRDGSPFFEIVTSQHTLARLLRWKGELPEAIALYRAAIERAKREFSDAVDPEILRAEAELADTLAQAGRMEEAMTLIERVMRDFASREPGFAAHEAAVVHGGLLAHDPGTRNRAGEILEAALAGLDESSHDSRLARRQALAALARLAESNGELDEALKRWREALAHEGELTPGEPEWGRAARELERLESS